MTFYERTAISLSYKLQDRQLAGLSPFSRKCGAILARNFYTSKRQRALARPHLSSDIRRWYRRAGSSESPFLPGRHKNRYET